MKEIIEILNGEVAFLESQISYDEEYNKETEKVISKLSEEIEKIDNTLLEFKNMKNRYFSEVSPYTNAYSEEIVDSKIKDIEESRIAKYNRLNKIKSNFENAKNNQRRNEISLKQLEELINKISSNKAWQISKIML